MAARVDEKRGTGIDLAREQPFQLGALKVFPGTRQVSHDGRAITLEPRIMQVLVALARADGEILSRADLTDLCWNGRTVGDNAIHRAVSKIRDLGSGIAACSFTVETISKVGYRLLGEYRPAGGGDSPNLILAPEALQSPPARSGGRRALRLTLVAAAVGIILVAGVFAGRFWGEWGSRGGASIAVAAQPDSGSEGLAREISVDLARLAGARETPLRVTDEAGEGDFIVRVAQSRAGHVDRVDLSLIAGATGEMLWTSSLERMVADGTNDLRPEVSARLGQVLLCALGDQEGQGLSFAVLRLFLSACEKLQGLPDQQLLTLLQRVTQAAPGFARGWGELAMAEARQYRRLRVESGSNSPEARTLQGRVEDHIRRARAIDPQQALASAAEAELVAPEHFEDRLRMLESALSQNEAEPLLHVQHSRALTALGRLSEAVQAAQRAAALDPLSPDTQAILVGTLAHSGALNRARRELTKAERLWPGSEQLDSTRFSLEMRYGDPWVAQRMIDSGRISLGGSTGGFGGPEILMRARLEPTAENIRRVVRFASVESARAPQAVPLRMQALGHAGAKEEFFAMIDQPGIVAHLRDATDVLFRPHLKVFRDDVRFLAVAARLGLLQSWASSGDWPDFCRDPRLPYDCRREGARILG